MSQPDRMMLVKGLLSSAGFLAAGLGLRYVGAPAVIAWPAVVLGALGFVVILYGLIRPPAAIGDAAEAGGEPVVLRDGRDYRIDAADDAFALTHLASGTVERVPWRDVTGVLLVAIDGFPAGSLSYIILRRGASQVEVPTDAAGNEVFLHELQSRFEGFDNDAFIQAMGSLHGFWELWPPKSGHRVSPGT